MKEQIVVSCRRSIGEVGSVAAAAHLDRARGLAGKAEALGGTVSAWGATTVTFSFDADAIDEVIALTTDLLREAPGHGEAWACGIAHGTMALVDPSGTRAKLAWGPPLVAAEALARIARPGEIVVARDLPAVRARLLTPMGRRTGYDEDRRVRGMAIDARQPWRRDAAAMVERVVEPTMFGRERLAPMLAAPGTLGVVNAEPGYGGSRFLAELAVAVAPSPVLIVSAVGAGLEPLGSLRHAFARFMSTHPERIGAELLPLLDRLLTGAGVDATSACALILTALGKGRGERPGALLLDDAHEIDEETVEVCARAAKAAGDTLHIAVRSDGAWELPPVLTRLARGVEITLSPFGVRDGEAFAAACVGNMLTEAGQERWSRRGGFTPLGVVEAITTGFVSGDLVWLGEQATARRRFSGKGRPRDATEWIRDRAGYLDDSHRAFASALALLGGRATLATLDDFLGTVGVVADARAVRNALLVQRWVRRTDDMSLSLPSRTHARALLSLLDEETTRRWHAAASDILAREPGVLAIADAAFHASKARDVARAADLARAAADVAKAARLDDGADRLVAFARNVAPDGARGLSVVVPELHPVDGDEDPTNDLRVSAAFRAAAASNASEGSGVHESLDSGEYAFADDERDSTTDSVAVPDVVDDGESEDPAGDTLSMRREPVAPTKSPDVPAKDPPIPPPGEGVETAREAAVRAAGAISLGRIPEILKLRAAKSGAEKGSLATRCQATLALAVALASVGRVEEALLEGLDALARAREEDNERGLEACLAFLAKLFGRVSRGDEARRLSMAARRPVDERLRPPY